MHVTASVIQNGTVAVGRKCAGGGVFAGGGELGLLANSHGWPKAHTHRCRLVTLLTKL